MRNGVFDVESFVLCQRSVKKRAIVQNRITKLSLLIDALMAKNCGFKATNAGVSKTNHFWVSESGAINWAVAAEK